MVFAIFIALGLCSVALGTRASTTAGLLKPILVPTSDYRTHSRRLSTDVHFSNQKASVHVSDYHHFLLADILATVPMSRQLGNLWPLSLKMSCSDYRTVLGIRALTCSLTPVPPIYGQPLRTARQIPALAQVLRNIPHRHHCKSPLTLSIWATWSVRRRETSRLKPSL